MGHEHVSLLFRPLPPLARGTAVLAISFLGVMVMLCGLDQLLKQVEH